MQSEEERTRYDRQVRLWGSGVQQRLQTTVLVVDGVGPDETLKNLVLAGIGKVRIIQSSANSTNGSPDAADDKSFASRSVVALSGSESSSIAASASGGSNSKKTKEQYIVDGLRVLNNLIDAQIFNPDEQFPDASCILLLLTATSDSGGSSSSSTSQIAQRLKPDVICHLRVFSERFAFAELNTSSSDPASQQQQQQQQQQQSCWQPSNPHPPIVPILIAAARMAQQQQQHQPAAAEALSFVDFIDRVTHEQPHAVAALSAREIELVAAEFLPACGGGNRGASIVLNSLLGGSLAQQISAHVCQARGVVVQASGGQPAPHNWILVRTVPAVESVMG